MSGNLQIDKTGADTKVRIMQAIGDGRVVRYLLEWFGATSTKALKLYVTTNMKKRPERHTSELENNTSFRVEGQQVTVGTGVNVGLHEVKYASIQDQGGDIVPRNRKFLTVPFPGVKGTADMYRGQSFVIKTVTGKLLIVQKFGRGDWKPLFSLEKKVTLPRTGWFTDTMDKQLLLLEEKLAPAELLRMAEALTGEKMP